MGSLSVHVILLIAMGKPLEGLIPYVKVSVEMQTRTQYTVVCASHSKLSTRLEAYRLSNFSNFIP